MALQDELKKVGELFLFHEKISSDVSRRNTTMYAVGFIVATSLLSFLLSLYLPLPKPSPLFVIFLPVIALGITWLSAAIFHACALLFKGVGSITGLFRVFGYLSWIGILQTSSSYVGLWMPFLDMVISFLVGAYSAVLTIYAIKNVEGLSWAKAIAVLFIPLAVFVLFALFLMYELAANYPVV